MSRLLQICMFKTLSTRQPLVRIVSEQISNAMNQRDRDRSLKQRVDVFWLSLKGVTMDG